jgi:hypothetical protein
MGCFHTGMNGDFAEFRRGIKALRSAAAFNSD